MGGLLEMRVLFEGGPYMRKYGKLQSHSPQFFLFQYGNKLELLMKTIIPNRFQMSLSVHLYNSFLEVCTVLLSCSSVKTSATKGEAKKNDDFLENVTCSTDLGTAGQAHIRIRILTITTSRLQLYLKL